MEQRIQATIKTELKNQHADSRRQLAAALAHRFDYDVDKTEAALQDTRRSDWCTTGRIAWTLPHGMLMWSTRPGGALHITSGDDLQLLYKRLARKNRRGWYYDR